MCSRRVKCTANRQNTKWTAYTAVPLRFRTTLKVANILRTSCEDSFSAIDVIAYFLAAWAAFTLAVPLSFFILFFLSFLCFLLDFLTSLRPNLASMCFCSNLFA